MDWTMLGGFVALAALMVGLFRDVKSDVRDLRSDVSDIRNDNRELRRDFEDLRTDLRAEMRQGIEDLRAETRAAHAQTGQRIDDMHATLLAIVPRAAAEPADRA